MKNLKAQILARMKDHPVDSSDVMPYVVPVAIALCFIAEVIYMRGL